LVDPRRGALSATGLIGLRNVGVAIPIPRSLPSPQAEKRLRRLRSLAWFLDRSIPIGRWRIGVDPILGLLPGAGDWIGAVLSLYVLYEGARLGMPMNVVVRMAGNILVETVVGAVPVLGDIFDFAWQANTRNLALIEEHYHPAFEGRSLGKIWLVLGLFCAFVLALLIGIVVLVVKVLESVF
jgi:hypothetical protein